MSAEYPESPGECYVDRDDLGEYANPLDAPLLLDADTAANFIAGLIQDFTGEEVDGEGDPWTIACDHLYGLLHNLNEGLAVDHDGLVDYINHEYGYSIGQP